MMFKINRAFKSPKTILSIDMRIEQKGHFIDEAVFLKINEYANGKDSTMQLHTFDMRAFAHALHDLEASRQTRPFKNFTESKGVKKVLTCATGEKGGYFVNIAEYKNGTCVKELAHVFGSYSIRALADTIMLMCDETEKALFALQSNKER